MTHDVSPYLQAYPCCSNTKVFAAGFIIAKRIRSRLTSMMKLLAALEYHIGCCVGGISKSHIVNSVHPYSVSYQLLQSQQFFCHTSQHQKRARKFLNQEGCGNNKTA